MWEAREDLWLGMVLKGHRPVAIAVLEGLSPRRIQLGVSRARRRAQESLQRESRLRDLLSGLEDTATQPDEDWDPKQPPILVPLFPVGAFTPRSTCPHHGPIREGSAFCCMVCNHSGMDAHPALKRDPRTDPRPEPKPPEAGKANPTRKQRRKLLRGAGDGPTIRRAS